MLKLAILRNCFIISRHCKFTLSRYSY